MSEVRIALQTTTAPANTNGTWNSITSTSASSASLSNFNGTASAWTLTAGPGWSNSSTTAPSAGTGDASWVDEQIIASEFWNTSAGSTDTWRRITVNVDDLSATYTVKTFSYRGLSGRDTGVRVQQGVEQAVTVNDMSESAIFTGVAPDGVGDIDVEIIERNGDNFGYINAIYVEKEVTGPTVTDVDTDESVYPGQSFVITGTNFGATQGTGGVDIDGVAQTVTAWGDTSITCTAVRGGNSYGSGKTLTVTTDAAATATISVAQEAEPGTFAVTAASPNTTDTASLWTGLVDTVTGNPVTIVDGDQAWVKNPNNLTNLAVQPHGTITADQTGDFVVQIWLASEGVWGSDQTVSFTLPSAIGLLNALNKRVQLSIGVGL